MPDKLNSAMPDMILVIMSGKRINMKASRIKKNIDIGLSIGRSIRKQTSKEDMKIVRCILCQNEKNMPRVFTFLGISSFIGFDALELNKIILIGVFIELTRQ